MNRIIVRHYCTEQKCPPVEQTLETLQRLVAEMGPKLKNIGFNIPEFIAYRPPLYPLLLGVIYMLFGTEAMIPRLFQILVGVLSCVLGTSGVVMAKTDDVKLDFENRGLHSFCYSMPGKWFLMGCTLAAGGSYQWLREAFSVIKPNMSFSDMNKLAESVPPGSEGLLFLPYLIGERTPHSDPMARGVFVGLSYRHTAAHLIRAVIEGVAFSQKDSVEILKSFSLTGKTLIVSGGAAKSPLWCQVLADVTGIPTQTTNIEDPASSGAAFIAGVGSRLFRSFEEVCERFIRKLASFEPTLEEVKKRYDEKYIAYQKAYQGLKEVFPLLQA